MYLIIHTQNALNCNATYPWGEERKSLRSGLDDGDNPWADDDRGFIRLRLSGDVTLFLNPGDLLDILEVPDWRDGDDIAFIDLTKILYIHILIYKTRSKYFRK